MGQELPAAAVNSDAYRHYTRSVYILMVLETASLELQVAIRDAAAASGSLGQKQLANILTMFLYPAAENPNGNGPFIAPLSNPTIGSLNLTFPGSWIGKDLRFEVGHSIDTTPEVSSASSLWPTTPTPGVRFEASQIPVFVKARYFVGSTPVSNQSFAAYRIDLSIDKDAFITAFKRRSAITGGTRFINNGHVWPSQLIP